MIPPFEDHPLIEQYNDIKKYFRLHETSESRERMRELREYARLINLAEVEVAFDVTGSLNFGMTVDRSDVDIVLYLKCSEHGLEECTLENCELYKEMERLVFRVLIGTYARQDHDIQIIDCINMNLLGHDIETGNDSSSVLLRFAFYRSVCRAVNARLLRRYQEMLMKQDELVEALKPSLFEIFDELTRHSKHQLSLQKYRERLQERGVELPDSISDRIRGHLQQYPRLQQEQT